MGVSEMVKPVFLAGDVINGQKVTLLPTTFTGPVQIEVLSVWSMPSLILEFKGFSKCLWPCCASCFKKILCTLTELLNCYQSNFIAIQIGHKKVDFMLFKALNMCHLCQGVRGGQQCVGSLGLIKKWNSPAFSFETVGRPFYWDAPP